jgi:hypothetical protein
VHKSLGILPKSCRILFGNAQFLKKWIANL